jgi:two-component system, chemotaxis family, sensor kinase CheA
VSFQDRLEKISATIQELHGAAGDGPRTRQLIDALFRDVHSFKAAASAGGLAELTRTAHEFENLLHSVRTGKLPLDAEVLSACDETVAALQGESLSFNSDRLHQFTQHRVHAAPPLPDELASLKDEERHRAAAALQEGAKLYALEAVFEADDFDERFRQLKVELEKIAEIISTSARMEEDRIKFRILYAAQSEKIRVQALFQKAVHAGNRVAARLSKEVNFVTAGAEALVDQHAGDVLEDALLHLVRNAIGHGIETQGTVTLSTQLSAGKLHVFVTDDGRGIDPVYRAMLFQPGFSTATEVSEFSGRGVGLDAVKTEIEAIDGTINVTSELGQGASFVIKLPNPSSDA